METQARSAFVVGDWLVAPLEGTLSRGDDIERLEPKAMEVLVYLASRPGDVVTREELEREVWRGALVGYDATTSTIIKLRKALRDDARKPRFISTIPKRGYKLIAPVSAPGGDAAQTAPAAGGTVSNSAPDIALPPTGADEVPAKTEPADSPRPRRSKQNLRVGLATAIVAIVSLAIILGAWQAGWFSSAIDSPAPDAATSTGPSIVVLPFDNLGIDNKEDLLASGITEDIITDLSKVSGLLIIASTTSAQFKGTDLDPTEVGRQLKVAYLLKGSLRRLGDAVRVNVQLVDTETGFNTWAQRYDRKIGEFFAVQDEVTRRIVESIAVKLTDKEKQRLAHRATENLKAYDLFQEAQKLFKVRTKESTEDAVKLYRQAIELDPDYGRAYGALAVALATSFRDGWSDAPVETLDRALALAKKAVSLDEATPQTHWALGFVYLIRREFDEALQAAARTVEIAPNYADGYGLLAVIKAWLGDAKESLELTDKGVRLNPYYTAEYLLNFGIAYYISGQYDLAISSLEKAYERNPNNTVVRLVLIASYVRAGRIEDAQWMTAQLLFTNPAANVTDLKRTMPVSDKYRQALFEDLHKGGLPE